MFKFMLGMAMGWMTFTEEGKKTANEIGKRALHELDKTLHNAGILTDDEPKKELPSTDAESGTGVPGHTESGDNHA